MKKKLIPTWHPFIELFNRTYNSDNGLVCEEFTSETGASNSKPMGWLDRTWLVVFGNVLQKKLLTISASLILSLTLFQPGRRAYQVLQDFDVFPRIWTLFCYTLYQRRRSLLRRILIHFNRLD